MYPEEWGSRNCVLPPLIPRNLWHFSGGRERRRGKPNTGGERRTGNGQDKIGQMEQLLWALRGKKKLKRAKERWRKSNS